jgi:hypothetical protein
MSIDAVAGVLAGTPWSSSFADIACSGSRIIASEFARHNGTAPLPVWSSNKARHRLSRTGNRQLNAAVHRIAITQAHWHPEARDLLARREAGGDGNLEAIRVLKRRLSDIVYRALLDDANAVLPVAA